MKGRFAATNHAAAASFEGGSWEETLPLGNLVDTRVVSHPARCSDAADLEASQFEVVMPRRRKVNLVALLVTSLSAVAKYRLTFGDDDFEVPLYQTDWLDCFPRLWATATLDWEDPNFWTGRPTETDLDAYQRNVVLEVPAVSAARMRVELDDLTNPAGYFDIGFLFMAAATSPTWNFDWDSEFGLASRTLTDKTPAGRPIFDRRRAARSLRFQYSYLTKDEAMRFVDAGARNDIVDPVLFLPQPDDEKNLFREVFLARFQSPPSRISRLAGSAVPIALEEVIA